jgi:hypothetical protein
MFVPVPAVSPSHFTLFNPTRVGNIFGVSFTSQPGVTYTLQYKNSASDTLWQDSSSTSGDGTVKTLSDTSSEAMRLYRVSAQ